MQAVSALDRARDLLALTKPRLSTLVVFTAGGGLLLGTPQPTLQQWIGGVLGTTLMVAGANAMNQAYEHDTDGLMARTRTRPVPMARLPQGWAWAWGTALCMAAVPLLWTTTPLATALAVLALLLYVGVYTPLKRRTPWSTFIGAVPGALPPLIGWTAATGRLDPGGLLLFLYLFFWQLPHSLAIGTFRRDEYLAAGLRVAPIGMPSWGFRLAMVSTALPLVGLVPWLWALHLVGPVSAVVGAGLGGAFAILCAWGALRDASPIWARRVFGGSILLLSVVFAVAASGA